MTGIRFFIGLAVASALTLSTTAVPSKGQPVQQSKAAQEQSKTDQRGTEQAPVVVKVLPSEKSATEAAQEQQDRDDKSSADWWMVRLTGVIAAIGLLQTFVFGRQAKRLKETIHKMDEIAAGQTGDMKASIEQASRSAVAMEAVAAAMSTNVERLADSLEIQRGISDRQKLITEIQSRAYLAVVMLGVVPQNAKTGYRFEPRIKLVNVGNTPAYNVKFCTAADVLPFPLRPDFNFPLPEPKGTTSVIAARAEKVLNAVVPKIYPPVEEKQIKDGIGQRIFMWGLVEYDDAFKIRRTVRFGQSFLILADGNWMSHDTESHNDSD